MKTVRNCFFVLLAALALARLAVMIVTPVFDPSEGRYAAICANMAESGDFLVPRFIHDGVFQSFDGKPPLLFQTGGLFCRALGRTELAVRLPPFLAAAALLGLLFYTLRRLRPDDGGAAARLAVVACATSVAFYATAGFCMTDILLTCCVGGALLLETCFIQKPSPWTSRAVFALLGLGMLVKGPVALVLFGLPVALDAVANHRLRQLARHDWIGGPLLFLLIAAPWYALMERATPGFLKYFFLHENLLRFLVHDYGDKYGAGRETFRGMALVWAAVVTLPWTPLLFWRRGSWRETLRAALPLRSAAPDTLLAWGLVAITGFWCLTSRVPLAYLLPAVPLFAARLALCENRPAWTRRVAPAAAVLCVIALVGTLAYTSLFTSKMPGWTFRALRAEDPGRGVSFLKREPPYSAEFYFGPRLHLAPRPGDRLLKRRGKRWIDATP